MIPHKFPFTFLPRASKAPGTKDLARHAGRTSWPLLAVRGMYTFRHQWGVALVLSGLWALGTPGTGQLWATGQQPPVPDVVGEVKP
ncbi:hypothetical protein VTO42DRAFT_2830 [Malbranchea cinnamomea]